MIVATAIADRSSAAPRADATSRDLRIDFFRGLALIFIFIDHMAGNSLMHFTMRAIGLSDAAEVFVLLAGYSAFLAYSSPLHREGLWLGSLKVLKRVRDLYVAHVLLVVVCVAFLAVVARYFENPLYFEYVNLTPFAFDPLGAIWRFMILLYQPGYLNILPLYMVLLAAFPLIWLGMHKSPGLTLGVSIAAWLAAGTWLVNLPSWPEVYGWYFNPVAWQLLFTIGVFAAYRARAGAALPRSPILVAVALAYVVVGFVVAAPWINIPYLGLPRLVAFDALGHISKSNLSLWRIGHVLSVAYLVTLLVPATAAWLRTKAASAIIHCGRNSLDIFCLGTLLSFCGLSVLLEAGRTWEFQLIVNVAGLGAMLWTAAWLSDRKAAAKARARQLASDRTPAAKLSAGPIESS